MPSPWTLLITVHAVAAGYSLIFGAVNLLRRRKGGHVHKIIGRIWVAAMYVVVLSSFGIRTLDGGFNWLHALSLLTFCTLSLGLWAARKGRIKAHSSLMRGSYFGLLGAFVGVAVVPTRRIPEMAVHDLPGLSIWVLLLLLTAGLAIAGLRQFRDVKPAGAHALTKSTARSKRPDNTNRTQPGKPL